MTINHIAVDGFRNLDHVAIDLHSHVTLIHGENGSGKTSLLEVIYYMVYGRSFRTSSPLPILQEGCDEMIIRLLLQVQDRQRHLAMSRGLQSSQIRLDRAPVKKRSEIAILLPVQFFDATTYRHLASGPSYRREFLDWGVFHVKHRFKNAMQTYKKSLQHRNSLLKLKAPASQLRPWTESMVQMSDMIHEERGSFFELLNDRFQQLWEKLGHAHQKVQLVYKKGWDGENLFDVLNASLEKDYRLGYTSKGPHRADLSVEANQHSAFDWLSQGQQKVLAYALYLAQLIVLEAQKEHRGIFLLDDLPAELDHSRQQHLVEALLGIGSQLIVTGINQQDLVDIFSNIDSRSYAVSQGRLEQV